VDPGGLDARVVCANRAISLFPGTGTRGLGGVRAKLWTEYDGGICVVEWDVGRGAGGGGVWSQGGGVELCVYVSGA
jgi:hypothetical protein